MNSEKIMIEVKCIGIGRSFDCIVQRNTSVGAACADCLRLVEQVTGICYGEYPQVMLICERTGRIIASELTMDEAGIDSGDTLYLI